MACRHAYKMLDRAEDLTCEDCLFEIKAQEYERGLKDAQQKPTVTREEIFKIIQATIDCKDIDTLIQRYAVILKELGVEMIDADKS